MRPEARRYWLLLGELSPATNNFHTLRFEWREQLYLAFIEEAQQYGEIDEMLAVSKTLRDCMMVYNGDCLQTPEGIGTHRGAQQVRLQLTQQCHGLRRKTNLFMPHELSQVFKKLFGRGDST